MKKCIVLTDSPNLVRHFKSAMRQHDLDIEKEPLLNDIKSIKDNILRIGNTSDIRLALGRYIKTNGMPPLVVLDYTMNLGLSKLKDPDNRKLLRTFLISYAILLQGKGYSQKKNLIILTCEEKHEKFLKFFCKEPHQLFKLMTTENSTINAIIKSFSENPARTKEFFEFDYLVKPTAGVIQGQVHKIFDLIARAKLNLKKHKISLSLNNSDGKNQQGISLKYLFENNRFYDNGKFNAYQENEHGSITPECLVISGQWLSLNQIEVSEKILKAFKDDIIPELEKGLEDNGKKNIQHKINICISKDCKIEPGMLPSLINLIEKELIKLGKVSVNITPENKNIISKTAGFKLLENYILRNL